nr:unnamed protein product [Digitaria exilis]
MSRPHGEAEAVEVESSTGGEDYWRGGSSMGKRIGSQAPSMGKRRQREEEEEVAQGIRRQGRGATEPAPTQGNEMGGRDREEQRGSPA